VTDDDSAYREWKQRTFGTEYEIWHDGLYTAAVTSLTGSAREEALRMLRIGLSVGDSHAAEALAAMQDTSAISHMQHQLSTLRGAEAVRTALALRELTGDESLAAHLITVLETSGSWSERIDAAMGLRHFTAADSEAALLATIERDPEYLVRYHACDSLLVRWRIEPHDIAAHPDIFPNIIARDDRPLDDSDRARFATARRQIEALRR
jgi:HEAT repeat protein